MGIFDWLFGKKVKNTKLKIEVTPPKLTKKKSGKILSYYKNNQIKSVQEWDNGKKIGTWISYYKNGQIKSEKSFKKGKIIEDSIKMYNDSGVSLIINDEDLLKKYKIKIVIKDIFWSDDEGYYDFLKNKNLPNKFIKNIEVFSWVNKNNNKPFLKEQIHLKLKNERKIHLQKLKSEGGKLNYPYPQSYGLIIINDFVFVNRPEEFIPKHIVLFNGKINGLNYLNGEEVN